MKNVIRWTGIVLGLALIVIQFIRPERNHPTPNDAPIHMKFPVPAGIDTVLRRSCFDCHSNQTVYPWYSNIQPMGWWLQGHVNQGKREVNFDEYSSYRAVRQFIKFRDIKEQLEQDEMPLPSYLMIHRYARLSPEEKALVIRWSEAMQDSMKVWYPADSLRRQRSPELASRPPLK